MANASLRAHVRNGRLVLDEPTDLPDGTVVELVAVDEKKRTVLRDALDAGIAELDAGHGVETSPDELLAEVYADVGLAR